MSTGIEMPGAGREDPSTRGSPQKDYLRWPPILDSVFEGEPFVAVKEAEEFDVIATVQEGPFERLNNIVGVYLWLLLCPPAGFYFLWKSVSFSRTAKEVISSVYTIVLVMAFMVGLFIIADTAEIVRDMEMVLPDMRPVPFMVYP